jgi:ABC-type molybdenum transport system ATPase subunit/photorepair protein PhrA
MHQVTRETKRHLPRYLLFHGSALMPVISVRDLVVEYEGRRVLNKLNLDIEAGETMVLTLLRGVRTFGTSDTDDAWKGIQK